MADGSLDTVSLLAFASDADGGDVFVVTWYDQSLSNDATQGTAASQPKIVSGGSLVEDKGKAAVDFDGTNDYLQLTSTIDNGGTESIFTVCNSASSLATKALLRFNTNTYFRLTDAQSAVDYSYGFPTSLFNFPNNTNQKLISAISASNVKNVFRNGSGSSSNPITDISSSTAINRISSSSLSYEGYIQEMVIYASDQSSNRTGVETNINTFYSIYP